ncbi:hypothetical protein QCE62_19810 [Caballeronia sp. LZ033]|uniref:hypothetical protein n=1 Tax=Caballeronia sp. LZ033 TaxID=3038566 RepID=UPI00285E3625|nr:hypothetical protein [Caballeronia sp. LZ033]MDR5815837.1 hypothetical protein [Caballeronia sp. LZ033]
MKERPILFSGPMVRALLDGRKTQTRRVVKARPGWPIGFVGGAGDQDDPRCYGFEDLNTAQWWTLAADGGDDNHQIPCPYGAPGDRLWVRETFLYVGPGSGSDLPSYQEERANPANHKVSNCWYRASRPDETLVWSPSIHMPRWASRITLEVTGVRVERLDQITEDDAQAEGAAPAWLDVDGETVNLGQPTYRQGFARLWRDINGDESWDANPWVWVVEFRRIEASA